VSPAGRRPGDPGTRELILDAARAEFAERGYTAATVRQVARRAGVDPALVYHYFADKPGLFTATLELPADPREVQARASAGGPDGARIAEAFLAQWEQGDQPGQNFVTLTQAVSSSPEVAAAVREFLIERVWSHRPGYAADEAVRITSALVSAQLLGLALSRYVLRVEPFASAPRARVAAWAGPAIEAAIASQAS
jgi:AcrR family transcriptional regulator